MGKKVTDEKIIKHIRDYNFKVEFIKTERRFSNGRPRIYVYFRCECGNGHNRNWDQFKLRPQCLECAEKNRREKSRKYTKDFVVKYLKNNGYEILSDYTHSGASFKYKCMTCGNTGRTNFGNFLDGRRCASCLGLTKRNTESYTLILNEMTDGEYSLIGEYVTAHVNVTYLHNICGSQYTGTPHNFRAGKRCPVCKESKGERKIRDYLISNNFKFDTQVKFQNCKNIQRLPFDFGIYENDNLKLLVEYDGIQHYEVNDFFGGKDALERIQLHDEIKNNYCIENNIELLRIPYWDFNKIEIILEEVLI